MHYSIMDIPRFLWEGNSDYFFLLLETYVYFMHVLMYTCVHIFKHVQI